MVSSFRRPVTAVLAALALAPLGGATAGCASDAGAPPTAAVQTPEGVVIPRAYTDLHMVLPRQPEGANVVLEIGGRTMPVKAHTSASLAMAPTATGRAPTHFVSGVPFSTVGPQSYQVIRANADGTRTMLLSGIHVPSKDAPPVVSSSRESAKSIVFRDPALMTIDTAVADAVMAHIVATPSFARLVTAIDDYGPEATIGSGSVGWQVEIPSLGSDGKPVIIGGHPASHWVTAGSPAYLAAGLPKIEDPGSHAYVETPYDVLGIVQAEARLAVRADEALAGKMYAQATDTTVRVSPKNLTATGAGKIEFSVDDPQWKGDRRVSIVETKGREVTFAVENNQWRRQGVSVRFLDGDKKPIPKSTLSIAGEPKYPAFDAKLPFSRFLGVLEGRYTVLGVPLSAESKEEYTIELPEGAESFEVNVASAGLQSTTFPSYRPYEPEPMLKSPGELQTLLLDVALPTMALVTGAGSASLELPAGKELIADLAEIGVGVALELVMTGAVGANGVSAFSTTFATELLAEVLTKAPKLATDLVRWGAEVSAEKVMEANCAIIGAVFEAIDLLGTAAQLGETIGTIANNAPFTYDRIAASETVKVRIAPKPEGDKPGFFGKAAKKATATIYYSLSSTPTVATVTVDPSQNGGNGPATIEIPLLRQPVGGTVRVKVALQSDNGWVAGQGEAEVENDPDANNTVVVPITVEQNPTPIDAHTTYAHARVLAYANGHHAWVESASAPNVAGPSICDTSDTSHPWLCGAGSLTYNAGGVLGYSWTGSGTALAACGSGNTNTIGSMAQTINVNPAYGDGTPDQVLQTTSCGSASPVFLAFDPTGSSDGRHVMVTRVGDGYQVFGVKLSKAGSLDPADTSRSYGRLRSTHVDAITLNPATGKLLALDKGANAVEVLDLASAPVPVADAPVSHVVGGEGAAIGRLHDAQAIAFLPAGAGFLVLEGAGARGAGRVQAFTFDGASADVFGGGASFALQGEGDQRVTYTDMKIDPTQSYVYVSSYVGDAPKANDYRLDIYRVADGGFVSRTSGVVGAKIAIDQWRDLYTLNYANVAGTQKPEPSVSEWIAPPIESK